MAACGRMRHAPPPSMPASRYRRDEARRWQRHGRHAWMDRQGLLHLAGLKSTTEPQQVVARCVLIVINIYSGNYEIFDRNLSWQVRRPARVVAGQRRCSGGRTRAAPRPLQQLPQRRRLDRPRVPVGVGNGNVAGLVEPAGRHADLAQGQWNAELLRQVEHALRRFTGTQRAMRRIVSSVVATSSASAWGIMMAWVSPCGREKGYVLFLE